MVIVPAGLPAPVDSVARPVPAADLVLSPIADEPIARSARHGRWWRRLVVIAGVVALAAGARWWYFRPVIVPVTATPVARGVVEDLVTNNKAGTVTARRRASLSPEIGGRVVELRVAEGERVRKGAVLLAVGSPDLAAQVALQERSLDAARSAETEACANASFLAGAAERAARLLAVGADSQQSVDAAENQRRTASALCAAMTARVAQASAAVDIARASLAKSVLRAPYDGIVVRLSTHLGEWIAPAPGSLAPIELIDVESIYVSAPLDEVDAGRVQPGLQARITMDAWPNRSFAARVLRVGAYVSEAAQQNRTFDIEAAFDDPSAARTLLPGLSADVEVIVRAHPDVLRVPTSAIVQGGRVLVVRDDVLVAVPVETGLANWDYTEIRSGLRQGDLVVTSLDRPEVRAGAHVRVTGTRP